MTSFQRKPQLPPNCRNSSSQDERAYVYQATRPKNQVIKGMVKEFVDRVFNGSAERLVAHLLEDRRLSESELREIGRMIGKDK